MIESILVDEIPISTKWTLDAAGTIGRIAVESVYLIIGTATQEKGTGFLLTNGYIVTNEHVIRGNQSNQIIGASSSGQQISFSNSIVDAQRDLALLKPAKDIGGGLELDDDNSLEIGKMVCTWGFPLGYNGPAPLLSVGFLAGFNELQDNSKSIKHLVVNGAFNPGNSGGPLFVSGDNKVIGIVVSKHAPLTAFQRQALQVLSSQSSGFVHTATDRTTGAQRTFTEAQLVADLLTQLRKLAQVMIGEAISVKELKDLLTEHSIS